LTALLTSLQQDGSVMQDVRDLLDRYLKKERTVILAVRGTCGVCVRESRTMPPSLRRWITRRPPGAGGAVQRRHSHGRHHPRRAPGGPPGAAHHRSAHQARLDPPGSCLPKTHHLRVPDGHVSWRGVYHPHSGLPRGFRPIVGRLSVTLSVEPPPNAPTDCLP